MIEILKEKPKKVNPYYILRYNYMIGDADGYTKENIKVSLNNPYLERYVKLLNSLRPTKGTWGVMLSEEDLIKHLKEKQITKDDYNFLGTLMFEEFDDDPFKVPEENKKYLYEFSDGVSSDTEYSFLVFLGCELFYIDENNKKHKCKVT